MALRCYNRMDRDKAWSGSVYRNHFGKEKEMNEIVRDFIVYIGRKYVKIWRCPTPT